MPLEPDEDLISGAVADNDAIFNAGNFDLIQDERRTWNRGRKLDKLKEARYASNTEDRKWLAEWTAFVVSFWLIFVLVILMNQNKFPLSDSVLITLLGTTTLNVIGLVLIVLRGHFLEGKE